MHRTNVFGLRGVTYKRYKNDSKNSKHRQHFMYRATPKKKEEEKNVVDLNHRCGILNSLRNVQIDF